MGPTTTPLHPSMGMGWGHSPHNFSKNTFRIISGNTDGLSLTTTTTSPKLHQCISESLSLKANIICLQETNADFKQKSIRDIFTNTIRQACTHQHTSFSTSSIPAKHNHYLPGGTSITTLGSWTGARLSSGRDYPLGRWSWTTLQGKQDKKITIISAYRVHSGNPSDSPFKIYNQQYALLLQQGHTNPDPRTQTITDLENFIHTIQDTSHSIILCIDGNETLDPTTSSSEKSLAGLFHRCGLQVLSSLLPTTHDSNNKGSRLIDFIAFSSSLTPAFIKGGYLTYDAIIPSDHRFTFIDFSISTLFGQTPSSPISPSSRKLNTKIPKRC